MSNNRASFLSLAFASLSLVAGCAVAGTDSDELQQTDDTEAVGEAESGAGGVIVIGTPYVNKLIGKTINIVARNGTKCLEVPNGNYTSGQNIQQNTCTGDIRQQFVVQNIPAVPGRNTNGVLIKPIAASNLCFDLEWGTSNGGERLQVYTCNYQDNQAYYILGPNNAIQPRYNNLCLDVVGGVTTNGAEIQQYGCHTGWNQDWLYWDVNAGAYINY